MKTTLCWLGALALSLHLCGCSALIKAASHADDAAKVGKVTGTVADAGQVAGKTDAVVQTAARAGDEAVQTGEAAARTAEQAGHNGDTVAHAADAVGHGADAVDILSKAYEVFEDSAEEDDNWEADEQAELEQATIDLKKEALTLQALSPEGKVEMAKEVEKLESLVQRSAQSKKLEDMRLAGRTGAELVSKVSAIRSGATMEPQ